MTRKILTACVFLMILGACGDSSSTPTPTAAQADADGDGFTPEQGDCDDANPNVHPNGTLTFQNAMNINEKVRGDVTVCCLPDDNDKRVREKVTVEVVNNNCTTDVTITSARLFSDRSSGPATFEPNVIPRASTTNVVFTDDFGPDPRIIGGGAFCDACGSSIFFKAFPCEGLTVGPFPILTCETFGPPILPRMLDIEHSLGTERVNTEGCLILYSCSGESSRDPACAAAGCMGNLR